jgi:isochorismate pyruvate lyase
MTSTDSQDRPPRRCENMAEVRAEIDRIDRVLVKLLSERQRYIERAAEIKSDRAAVRDEVRVEDVIAKVLAEARKAGLNAEIAEAVWRTLVERSIAYEFQTFDAKNQRSR